MFKLNLLFKEVPLQYLDSGVCQQCGEGLMDQVMTLSALKSSDVGRPLTLNVSVPQNDAGFIKRAPGPDEYV